MERMKILFVVPYVPNLIRVRPYHWLTQLAARGHELTLATLVASEEDERDLERLRPLVKTVIAERLPRWRALGNSLVAAAGRGPLQAAYCWQPALAARLRAASASGEFDVAHVEHLRGARFGLELLKPAQGGQAGLPVVWDSVDCISLLFEQAARRSKRLFSRYLTRFELARTQAYEGWLVGQFQRVLVTSALDREALVGLSADAAVGKRIEVLPNGVDLGYFTPPPAGSKAEPASLVISGKMSYHANVTMALHFAQDVMPLIWQRRPEVKLTLVGKDPTPELRALARDPRIEVTGTVEDIRPYLWRASVGVSPIVYGVGIQNKVLEAMACGLPVVCSPQAASALAVKPGEDLWIASQPGEYAEVILKLFDQPALRARLGQAGRAYVEKQHAWGSIAGQLENIYAQVKRGAVHAG